MGEARALVGQKERTCGPEETAAGLGDGWDRGALDPDTRRVLGVGPGHIPADRADEAKDWVIGGPAKQGLDRANGTHGELAGHRLRAKGARTRRGAVPRFGSQIGIRPDRPADRYLRGNPETQSEARAVLADLGTGLGPGRWSR